MTVADEAPLAGIRVFDLTSAIMAPLAAQQLGDLGADVLTVETPKMSMNRGMTDGPVPGLSGMALNLLRNKRSLIVDLKAPTGREIAVKVAASCDVFVSNLRPASLGRLGLDHESLARLSPTLIYCQAQGFPMDSPQAEEPAYDDIIQAVTGVADINARVNGRPMLAPTILADKVCGLFIAQAVLAALVKRERTGKGSHIEVPMSDAMTSFMLVEHGAAAIGRPPQGPAGYQRIMTPNRRPAKTTDGWINVLPYSHRNYVDLFTAGGRPDLVEDPRIATMGSRIRNAGSLYQEVEQLLATRTTGEWLAFCRQHQIPASPIVTLEELVDRQPVASHPLAGEYAAVRPAMRFDGNPDLPVRRPAPAQGQDTEEILAEVGYSPAEIAELLREEFVRTSPIARN